MEYVKTRLALPSQGIRNQYRDFRVFEGPYILTYSSEGYVTVENDLSGYILSLNWEVADVEFKDVPWPVIEEIE